MRVATGFHGKWAGGALRRLIRAGVLGALSWTALCGLPAGAQQADKPPRIVVATNPGFVPFEMLDTKSAQLVGFDIEFMSALGKRAGFIPEYRSMDFNGIIPALQAGSIDMAISGISITAPRAKVVSFSDPYFTAGLSILVPESDEAVQGIAQLQGKNKKVATQLGTTSVDFIKREIPQAELIPYPDQSQMFMAVMTGAADAAVFDRPTLEYFVSIKGQGRVKVVGPLYQGEDYGIAFPKRSPWLPKINKALADMKQDGSLKAIADKWFHAGKSAP